MFRRQTRSDPRETELSWQVCFVPGANAWRPQYCCIGLRILERQKPAASHQCFLLEERRRRLTAPLSDEKQQSVVMLLRRMVAGGVLEGEHPVRGLRRSRAACFS